MKLKLTLLAIKNSIGIHIAAVILLSLLFFSEVNLYHYFLMSSINHNDINSSSLANSSYTFDLTSGMNQNDLEILDKELSDLYIYEDIVITGCQMTNEEIKKENPSAGNDDDLVVISFYPSISKLHNFKSFETNERYSANKNDDIIGMRIGHVFTDNCCVIEGKEYKVVRAIYGFNSYRYNDSWDVMCVPYNDFWDISSNCTRITIEFSKKLNDDQLDEVLELVRKRSNIDSIVSPQRSIDVSFSLIEDNTLNFIVVFIVMVVATTCILPIIKYCLWKRHYEFSSYRMCGADYSFIRTCEFIHVSIIGISSIILGTIISINKLNTDGFIIVLLLSSVLFFIRLFFEVLIDSNCSQNIMEVNRKWKL